MISDAITRVSRFCWLAVRRPAAGSCNGSARQPLAENLLALSIVLFLLLLGFVGAYAFIITQKNRACKGSQ